MAAVHRARRMLEKGLNFIFLNLDFKFSFKVYQYCASIFVLVFYSVFYHSSFPAIPRNGDTLSQNEENYENQIYYQNRFFQCVANNIIVV